MNNTFEYATRNKLRFPSTRGDLNVEQLWDMPLSSNDNFNLDAIAINLDKLVKDTGVSYVKKTRSPAHARLEASLEVVKYVIETKLAEEEAAKNKAKNKKEKEQLLGILAEKQAGKLSELSEKELKKRIAELED